MTGKKYDFDETTKRFAEAMRAELVRQGEVGDLWNGARRGDTLDAFSVDGEIDLLALADVAIKMALDERFAS